MGLNLAEIQQKLDRLIQNISEQNRRAYQIFYDPNPQDVTLPQLDKNGNLVNVTIPNRAKILADFTAWREGAREEFGTVNLLKNTQFLDSNDDNFPDGYYTYYSSSATKTYTLITPDKNAADGTDEKIASQVLAKAFTGDENDTGSWTHDWSDAIYKILKVTLQGFEPGDIWSLNQKTIQIPSGSTITRGVSIYIPEVYQDISFSVFDNPGGSTYDGLDDIVNQSGFFNLYAVQKGTASGNLGFLLNVSNKSSSTKDITFYVGFPVFALGHTNNLKFIPEVNK